MKIDVKYFTENVKNSKGLKSRAHPLAYHSALLDPFAWPSNSNSWESNSWENAFGKIPKCSCNKLCSFLKISFVDKNDAHIQKEYLVNRNRIVPVRCSIVPVRCKIVPVRCRIVPVRGRIATVRCRVVPVRCRIVPVRCKIVPVSRRIVPVQVQDSSC